MAVIDYPTFLQPATTPDIVGFNFTLTDKGAQSPRYVSFGQAFEAGKVATTAALVAKVGAQTAPAQMDWTTKHPDGSVKFASITVPAPTMVGPVQGMLSLGGTVAPHLPVLTALKTYNVIVTFFGGVAMSINVGEELIAAIRAKTHSYWLRGEHAVQTRVEIPVAGMRLVADVTAYADGTFATDLCFRNEYAFEPGGTISYGVSVFQNGVEVYHLASLQHWYAESWRLQFHTKGAATDETHNVQHDIAYLINKAKVLPNYDLTSGIDDVSIDSFPSVNVAPLSIHFSWAMPSAGHRDDIGPMPGWYARWVKCQGWKAARCALAMANSAAGIPWHHYERSNGDYISLDDHPTLWIDYRGTPTISPEVEDPRWYLDNAHTPDVAFIPYLLTGQRFYLDELTAQTSRQLAALWNQPRQDGKGLAMVGTDAFEVRAQVWTFRNLIEMTWAVPDNHPSKPYWRRLLDNNYDNILDFIIPAWTSRAGEVAGYFYGVYGYTQMGPWQQDYAVSVLGIAEALRPLNNASALKMLKWSAGFNVGRTQHSAEGFGWQSAVAYQLYISDDPNGSNDETRWFKTWAKMGEENPGGDDLSGLDGGDWVALLLMTLATLYNTTGNAKALTAYNALKAKNAPGAAIQDFRTRYPQFHIVPKGTP
jgi:hypothetical protein